MEKILLRLFPTLFKMATRRAYGVALAKLGQASQRVVALDGDTKNSTFSETFKKAFPDRYIECFIAEQNMVCKYLSSEAELDLWINDNRGSLSFLICSK